MRISTTPRQHVLRPLAAIVLAAAPAALSAQALTLSAALQRAEQSAYSVRIAQGEAAASDGRSVAALRGILPSFRVEGAYLRTTDPLNAFGFTLRQRAVTLASFNPASLNDPAPIGNVSTALVMELPIFNADAWMARSAAVDARSAGAAAERWSRASAAFDVVRAYYATVLANAQIATLEAALDAARAHVRQAESMLRNGSVTKSDALIAAVKAGDAEIALVSARADLRVARQRLALALGTPADSAFTLPANLPALERVRAVAEQAATDSGKAQDRADVQAAVFAKSAAGEDVRRAKSLYIPSVNSIGRLDWNTASTPFGGSDSWTVGLMVSWTPFSGASQIGEVQMAQGRKHAAAAQAEAAAAQAHLDLQQANDALLVALARLGIAERAVEQSTEAHRIVSRKYEGGLGTVVELFDASAIETQSRLAAANARYQVIAASAGRLHALGLSLAPLTTLDQ
jgi:outer membrane protein TolC